MSGCLILIAHGSRDPRWRSTFENHLAVLRSRLGPQAVYLSYMEVTSPTLQEAVAQAVSDGHMRVDVLPLFMAAGGHVDHDIPRLVDEVKAVFPHVTIRQLPPVGEHPQMVSCIQAIAESMVLWKN